MGSNIENENLTIKRDVDIWSLGCVLSEVCTWVVFNWTYVEEYSKQRRNEVKKTGRFEEEEDCFHNGKDELLNCVDQIHTRLALDVRPRDYITKKVLKMIKDDMLRPDQISGARRPANYLCHEVENMIREAEKELLNSTRGSQSFESTHPDNGLRLFSGPPLIPPEPPNNIRRLNYNPPPPPFFQSETIPQRPFVHGGSPITNGQPRSTPRRQIGDEYSNYQQNNHDENSNTDKFEPAMSGPERASTVPHRPPSHYTYNRPGPLATSQDPAEDPFFSSPTGYSGANSVGRSSHRISNLRNQHSPVPGSPPTTPERTSDAPRSGLRIQDYSRKESPTENLQSQTPLPEWPVEDAQKWKRGKKDPKNHERINMPSDNDHLDNLKGRDHVGMLSSVLHIC